MTKDDRIRLLHMQEAAKEVMDFSDGKCRADLDRDQLLVRALCKSIEIIGEAASRVSKETQTNIPSVPWPSIVAMRNQLIHAYFDIDLDRLWDTVSLDIPPLMEALKKQFEGAE